MAGCDYQTDDVIESLVALYLEGHMHGHRASTGSQRRTETIKRPTLSSGISKQEWSFFKRDWASYENYLEENEMTTELFQCCDEELRRDLYRNYSDIELSTKDAIMKAMEEVAVLKVSFVVSQAKHMAMRQGRDEPIRKYYARLKGEASICEYLAKCECKKLVSYAPMVLRQIIAANVYDIEIKKDLMTELNNKKDEMTADEMVSFIESRENGNDGAEKLSHPLRNSAIQSAHKKAMKPQTQPTGSHASSSSSVKCGHCGKFGHGNHSGYANAHVRKRLGCPAYGQKCNKCEKFGHFASVCRTTQLKQSHSTAATEEEDSRNEVLMVGGAFESNM